MTMPSGRIDVWHNILWSAYKGEVFSALYEAGQKSPLSFRFFQIAETRQNRLGLSRIDLRRHRYPFDLLFKGTYEAVSPVRRLGKILSRTWRSDADLFILTGYEKPEIWAQMLLIKIRRKKVALFCDSTLHDNVQTPIKGLVKRLLFHSADGIFGYGHRTGEYVRLYGAKKETVFIGCQAAALDHEYTPERALATRRRLAPSSETPRFLYVGRLSSEKNLGLLLQAFATLKRRKPAASLLCVGDGPQRAALESQAQTLGLNPQDIFVGSKSGADLFETYATATALILPSLSEPWGLVVNEALASGCPAIVSERCGCCPELIVEGVTGYTHNAMNACDLARKMETSIERFSNTEETARACLNLIQNFTPAHAAENIAQGCRTILNVKGEKI